VKKKERRLCNVSLKSSRDCGGVRTVVNPKILLRNIFETFESIKRFEEEKPCVHRSAGKSLKRA
jgi:hypothetical protein